MVNVNACNQSVVDPFVWDGHSLITFSEAICPGQHVARFSGWFDVLGVDLFQIIHVTKSIRTHINYGTIWILIVSKLRIDRIANVLRTWMFWCQPGPGVAPFSFTELSSWPKLLPGDTGAGPFQWGIPPKRWVSMPKYAKMFQWVGWFGEPPF